MLAGHGTVNGIRILSPQRIDLLRACQTNGIPSLGPPTRLGLGYQLGGAAEEGADIAMGAGGGEFGHGGNGGSLGFADPVRKLGFGLTKNLMNYRDDRQQAAYRVAEAIRLHLDSGQK
jgi:CubicO group peptidase (beta-lactamase class C family)